MSANKHDVESEGSNPRDRVHPRKQFQWRHAHRDWRVWAVVGLSVPELDGKFREWAVKDAPKRIEERGVVRYDVEVR